MTIFYDNNCEICGAGREEGDHAFCEEFDDLLAKHHLAWELIPDEHGDDYTTGIISGLSGEKDEL